MTGIEGRIVITKGNLWYKIKTSWYSEIHKAKDELSSPRKLLLACANEVYDDLYALANEQERKQLDDALLIYKTFVSSNLKIVKEQHEQNKHLSRKDYALAGKSYFTEEKQSLFSPYMSLYIDYDEDKLYDDLKNIFIKNVDAFAL